MPALRSITTGKVFESSAADISLGIVPMVPLPQDHPFCVLLEEHMTAVTKPGTYDALIDAYIAISKGDPHWRQKARVSIGDIVAERRNMRKLLRQNPPDVIIVDQDPSKGYGFHERTPSMWSFICITKHYVDRWMAEEGLIKLGLEAVLKAAREHENGHWLFTLRAGYFSQVHLDADNLSSPEREIELAKISSQSPEGHKHIPKLLQACWNEDNREAGDWSEVQGRGGIIGFNNSFNIATIQTDADTVHLLPEAYLLALRQGTASHFVPSLNPPPSTVQTSSRTLKTGPPMGDPPSPSLAHSSFFPYCEDKCLQFNPQWTSLSIRVDPGLTQRSNAQKFYRRV